MSTFARPKLNFFSGLTDNTHMIDNHKLDFWIKHKQNVLFSGLHGVGKTTMVIDAFNRNGLNWMYFSAATMDPWVDFIGVPKEMKDEKGSYLELVRPAQFRDDEVQALFFDELNRSHKKVRNAVMELIQFKSINGRPFKNLKLIWGAINPSDEDDTYDVEKLDPAQQDRFHVTVDIPYALSLLYLRDKYGSTTATVSNEWWTGLSEEVRLKVSPRRLDYALDFFTNGGDMRDILPAASNVSKLTTKLTEASTRSQLEKFQLNKDRSGARSWLSLPNNSSAALPMIEKGRTMGWWAFFLPLLPEEVFAAIYAKNSDIRAFVASNQIAEFSEFLSHRTPEKLAGDSGCVFHTEGAGKTNSGQWDALLNRLTQDLAVSRTLGSRASIVDTLWMKMPHSLVEAQIKATFKLLDDLARRARPSTLANSLHRVLPLANQLAFMLNNLTGDKRPARHAPVLYRRMQSGFSSPIYLPNS